MAKSGGRGLRISVDDDPAEGETVDGEVQSEAEAAIDAQRQDERDNTLTAVAALEDSAEIRWEIHRIAPAVEAGYVCEMSTGELKLENIARVCGPGKYRARGYRANGQYYKQVSFTVAKGSSTPGTSLVPVAPMQQAQSMDDYLRFIERSKLAQKEDLKFWAGLIAPFAGPALIALINGMMSRKDTSMVEMVTALKSLKGMTDGGSVTDELAKLEKLHTLIDRLGGEKSTTGSTGWDIARDALAALPQVMQGIAAARSGQTGQGAPAPQICANDDSVQPQQLPENPMFVLINWLRAQVPVLVRQAQRNGDFEFYADYLADNVPAGTNPQVLKQFLSRDDWWPMFLQIAPAAQPFQPWFQNLRDELIKLIDDATTQQSGPEGK